jgi:hypothetical protein
MHVFHSLHTLHVGNLHWIDSANIALIPKKDGAQEMHDFRLISLIHAIAKITAKMVATRLAPHMNFLVTNAQSIFINKRSIHDNFFVCPESLASSIGPKHLDSYSSLILGRTLIQ